MEGVEDFTSGRHFKSTILSVILDLIYLFLLLLYKFMLYTLVDCYSATLLKALTY